MQSEFVCLWRCGNSDSKMRKQTKVRLIKQSDPGAWTDEEAELLLSVMLKKQNKVIVATHEFCREVKIFLCTSTRL